MQLRLVFIKKVLLLAWLMQANYDSLVHDINNSLLHFNAIIAPQTIVSHFPAVWHRLQKNKHYAR